MMKRKLFISVSALFLLLALSAGQAFSQDSWVRDNRSGMFFVSSNGMTGQQWLDRFAAKGIEVKDGAKKALLSEDFKPSDGVVTGVVIISGKLLPDSARIYSRLVDQAYQSGLKPLDLEVACLIRDLLDDQQLANMGFWWLIAMTEPVDISPPERKKSQGGHEVLLSTERYGNGTWFSAYSADPDKVWPANCGFAFAMSGK